MKIRSFIAINLPSEIKDCLGQVISELKTLNPDPNIKWVDPEGLHFTLHFLGYLEEQKLNQIKTIISQGVDNNPSTEIQLNNLGGFPNLNRPRVLFVSCREVGDSVLKNIQDKIGQQLEKIGLEIDKRPWQTHITLARFKTPGKIQIPETVIQNFQPPWPGRRAEKFKVQSIDLMKSELSRKGAHYTIIEKFSFKPLL